MAEEGPYEIMPYKEIVELRKQIQELKSKSSDTSPQLLDSISKLTEQMNSLMGLFKTAAEEMRLEEKDEHFVAKKLEPLVDKLDEIIDQNKTIAEGMVAVADMIKEDMEKRREPRSFLRPEPKTEFPSFEPELPKFSELEPKPMVKGPIRHTPPRPMPNIPMPTMAPMPQAPSFEPFPFEEPKKKGLFGRFKK